MSATSPFDLAGLYAAIDAQRTSRGLAWTALSKEVGVSASTIRRFGDADDAEADGVLALIRWLDVEPESFIADLTGGDRLRPAAEGFVRVDTAMVADALNEPAIAKRNRLTIQKFAAAAVRSGRSVGSLTRVSPF